MLSVLVETDPGLAVSGSSLKVTSVLPGASVVPGLALMGPWAT